MALNLGFLILLFRLRQPFQYRPDRDSSNTVFWTTTDGRSGAALIDRVTETAEYVASFGIDNN
jgi:hypothetical protein